MKHHTEDQIARFANLYYTPKDLRIKRMVIKNQTDSNGEAMVYIRLRRYDPLKRKDSQEKRVPTNVRVNPKFWSTKKGEVLRGDFDFQNKNRLIKEKESRISTYIHNPKLDYKMAQLKREEFLLIEQIFPSIRMFKYKKCLVDYIDDYYERRKKLGHPHGTIKEFKTVMNRIKRFDDSRNKKTYLVDINISWSDDFEVWLTQEEYTPGTIEKSYTVLITVLYYYWETRDETKIEITDKFQSKLFKRGEKSKNKPNPLTEEQLMALYNHKFDLKHQEVIRKMILLQCFTGVRYDDIKRIRPENIENGFLIFSPKKTERYDVEVEQPLNRYAKEILEGVNYDTSCYKLTNQAYNRGIEDLLNLLAAKEEYKDLKFKTDHTSHNFRDTFISLAVIKGVNWKSILKWVGQSSYSIMDRYIHLTKPFEESEMKKMFE